MRVDDCYQLGYVTKTHGLKGEIQIFLDVDFPEEYLELESMFVLKEQALIPFFLESIQINLNKAIVKLEDIDTIEVASELVSSEIYLPINRLPDLDDSQFYFHEIIGYTLYDKNIIIGKVKNVYAISQQNLIEVDCNGTEVLVPLTDHVVQSVDKKKKKVLTSLPDGLLDVYLDKS